jgi:branched-chain amino acid transport system substrate-binding protein
MLAAGMALTLSLAACAGSSNNDSGGGGGGDVTTVKIGFMGDLTGENSAIVIPPNNGAKLAIE